MLALSRFFRAPSRYAARETAPHVRVAVTVRPLRLDRRVRFPDCPVAAHVQAVAKAGRQPPQVQGKPLVTQPKLPHTSVQKGFQFVPQPIRPAPPAHAAPSPPQLPKIIQPPSPTLRSRPTSAAVQPVPAPAARPAPNPLGVILCKPAAVRSTKCTADQEKRWFYFKLSDISYWLERKIFEKYGSFLAKAIADKAERDQHILTFQADPLATMMESDKVQRPKVVAVRKIRSLEGILRLAAEIEAARKAFPVRFAGGTKQFSSKFTGRVSGYETYIETNPSILREKMNEKLKDVGLDHEEQARTIRRLLKGYSIEGDDVVKDEHLERMGALWGLAETVRNPGSLAHMLIELHLVKKGLVSWDDTVNANSENRFVPSGQGASQKIQNLRQEMLAKFTGGTPISKEMKTLTAPYRKNLGLFLQSACERYENMFVKISSLHDGEIKVERRRRRLLERYRDAPVGKDPGPHASGVELPLRQRRVRPRQVLLSKNVAPNPT